MPGSTVLGLLRGYITLAEGPRLLAAFRDGKVFQKRARFRREHHSVEHGDEQRLVEIKEIRKTMF